MAVPSNISLFNYRIHNDLNCDFCLHLCLHEVFVVFSCFLVIIDDVNYFICRYLVCISIVFQKVCKSQIFYFCDATFKNEYLWNLHMNKSRK